MHLQIHTFIYNAIHMHENCETFIHALYNTKGAALSAQSSFRVYAVATRLCFATQNGASAQLSCSCARVWQSPRSGFVARDVDRKFIVLLCLPASLFFKPRVEWLCALRLRCDRESHHLRVKKSPVTNCFCHGRSRRCLP